MVIDSRQEFFVSRGPSNGAKAQREAGTGIGLYPDGMVEHDGHVGKLLAKLEELGIA